MAVQPSDVLRVIARMSIVTEEVLNTYHVQYAGAAEVGNAAIEAAVADVLDDAYSAFLTSLSDALLFEDITLWNVTQDAPMAVLDWPTLTAGTIDVASPLPFQSALLVKFNTSVARSQGRKYICGLTTAQLNDSSGWTAGPQTAAANYAAYLVDQYSAGVGTFYFGCYRYSDGRFAQWRSASVSPDIKTQRRRAAGVGA